MDKKAIYKIENKINHKIYIGQSIHPEKRFQEHCWKSEKYYSMIHQAIQKYGVENFTFEIIGWFKDYNEKEKYYIQYYNSLTPYGYNMVPGGEEPPHPKGEDHFNCKLTEEEVKQIKQDMKNWDLPEKQILVKYKITKNQFRHIRDGNSWFDKNETYPLRPSEAELNELKADKVIELLQTTKISQKDIAKQVGWGRTAVTSINNGNNHKRGYLTYPIRH